MKKLLLFSLIGVLAVFLIPIATVSVYFHGLNSENSDRYFFPDGKKIKSFISETGKTEEFDSEEYLVGVVGAEMPASFPEEALKAQAVAARTFIIYKIKTGDIHEGGAYICTNPAHCKAWKSTEQLLDAWGEKGEEYLKKIQKAVRETKGEIMLYDGEPICAVYFSMSGGSTENSEDVWGGSVPYLKSVSSEFDRNAPNFNSEVAVTYGEFKEKLLVKYPDMQFADDPSAWVGTVIASQSGGVLSAGICGTEIKGTELRSLFGLRSHNFTLENTGEGFVFHVKGYGHGVGMSQWGCKFLAEEGKNYEEILKYYYSGAGLSVLSTEALR